MNKITFIMSVYNTKREWIERSVNSIKNQLNPNWKLIVIDDGSNEDTNIALAEVIGNDNRITVYHQKNLGLSTARNYGLDNADTDWITYVDADDWIISSYVEDVYKILEQHMDLDMLGIGHEDIWADKHISRLWGNKLFHQYSSSDKVDMQMALLQEPSGLKKQPVFFGAQWKFIYKRSFLNKYNIRNDPKILKAQDSVFNLYATEYAQNIGYYNKVLYHYFHNISSVTGGGFDNNIVYKLQYLVKAYKVFIDSTHKSTDRQYIYAWTRSAVLQFEQMLERYFCKDNNDSVKEKRKKMFQLFSNEPYVNVINGKWEGVSFYRHIILFLMKCRSYYGLILFYKIGRSIKQIRNR